MERLLWRDCYGSKGGLGMDALEGRATFIWYVSLAGWIFFILRDAPCFLILLSYEKA